MTVAMQSEISLNEWLRTAVETQRFFKGTGENISWCTAKTLEIIKMFIDPGLQTSGQRWLAEGLTTPLRNAVEEYKNFLVIENHAQKIFKPFSGASDSSAAVRSSSVYTPGEPGTPRESPESAALRKLLDDKRIADPPARLQPDGVELQDEPEYVPANAIYELGEAEAVRGPRGRTAAAPGSGVDTGS
eukprot:16438596-Heterocapsa_arctica.AAC.1